MPHRTEDDNRNRIRLAHHHVEDAAVRATENAYRAIARGEYRGGGDYRGGSNRDAARKAAQTLAAPTTDATAAVAVAARLHGERLGVRALGVPCPHASVGNYCWPVVRGFCAQRAAHAAATVGMTGVQR